MNGKAIWRSRTIWLMGLIIALNSIPEVRQVVPEGWLTTATAVAAIVLRLLTSEPVGLTGSPKEE